MKQWGDPESASLLSMRIRIKKGRNLLEYSIILGFWAIGTINHDTVHSDDVVEAWSVTQTRPCGDNSLPVTASYWSKQTADSLPAAMWQTHSRSLGHQQNKHLSPAAPGFSLSLPPLSHVLRCHLSVISSYCSNSADIWRPCRVPPFPTQSRRSPCKPPTVPSVYVHLWLLCKISSLFIFLLCACVFQWSKYCYTLLIASFLYHGCLCSFSDYYGKTGRILLLTSS